MILERDLHADVKPWVRGTGPSLYSKDTVRPTIIE
jgi:hypothetical protein